MHIFSPKNIKTLAQALILIVLGYSIGILFGSHLISRLIRGENSFLFLLYQPAYIYINTVSLLESNNDLKRLTGLYSLLESKKIDVDFLINRYKREESIYIKRTIIYLLGYAQMKKSLKKFLSQIYTDSPWRIKLEILRTIKRIDINSFNKFILDHEIDKRQFKGI